jgi:hypothetical protein
MAELVAEHATCDARIHELRLQNANLQALTTASRILAASPQRDNVLSAIADIVVGMIGGRELAIFEIDHIRQSLALVRAHGIDATSPHLIDAMPMLEHVSATGETIVVQDGESRRFRGLTAAVPLKLEGCVTGVIAIFRLVDRKSELEPVDHSLLEILTNQAAISLHAVAYKSLRPTVRPPPAPLAESEDEAT